MMSFLSRLVLPSAAVVVALSLAGCPEPRPPEVEPAPVDEVEPAAFATVQEVLAAYPEADAAAVVEPIGEGRVRGYVYFQQVDTGLRVTVDLEGLEPGLRGFHVHEHGSCEPGPDGTPGGAAGPHFDPFGRPHGGPHDAPEERHVGDFGNLAVGEDGTVRASFVDRVATLRAETGILGRSVIVHAQEDDLVTQPTGDAGPRIGCGVIVGR